MKLKNERHERFCLEYLKDLNATRAYDRTYPGASKESARRLGSNLLANVDVTSRIAELQKERSKKLKIDAEDVLKNFVEIRDECRKGVPVFDKEGNQTGVSPDYKSAISANREIGRHIGFYNDEITLRHIKSVEDIILEEMNNDSD